MSVITAEGCVIHKHVQFNRIEMSYQIFKCEDCNLDVDHEAEDGCN